MADGDDWTAQEVALLVADYLHMFQLFLAGQKFNKAEHLRRLQESVSRSKGSIEFKRSNVSAVLRDLDMQWLPGYIPRPNYQTLLAQEVLTQIDSRPDIDRAAVLDVERPAVVPIDMDFSRLRVEPPRADLSVRENVSHVRLARKMKRDYLAREARNSSLGRAGEEFVLRFEEWRLRASGQIHLANRIEHTAQSDDSAGYDILSYDLDGKERYIEVKTTAYAKETPFYVSQGEVEFASCNEDSFHLYRLFDFRREPRLFELGGALDKYCILDPVSYRASFS